jgi:hypothetical protein
MAQDLNDKTLDDKIKEAKRIYEEAMSKLNELEKLQKQILDKEEERAKQKQLEKIKQDINKNY